MVPLVLLERDVVGEDGRGGGRIFTVLRGAVVTKAGNDEGGGAFEEERGGFAGGMKCVVAIGFDKDAGAEGVLRGGKEGNGWSVRDQRDI